MSDVAEKVRSRAAKVAVIGLGYVGLPLAVESARAGFQTVGIDVAQDKVKSINEGKSYVEDIDETELQRLVGSGTLNASADFSVLGECDFISICVPTPLGKGKTPDISYIVDATEQVKIYLRVGQTIVLESTTYPGTTEEVVLPILEASGLTVGKDFHLAFSPERIDPGNKQYTLKNTPKIIGGVTPNCTEMAQSLYQSFIDQVIPASSTRAAEMVKILENTFRAINIGLANEVAIMCDHLGVDTWEVIEAAATKPFGFMPFYPGPGLGGHCIPIDPHYLVWKLKSLDYNPRFIQVADEINSSMPAFVVSKVQTALNAHKKALNGSQVLVLGVAYKKDVQDCRESPALDVIEGLEKDGAHVSYFDPHVLAFRLNEKEYRSVDNPSDYGVYDCVVIVTNHSSVDYQVVVDQAPLIVDTRNATAPIKSDKIYKI